MNENLIGLAQLSVAIAGFSGLVFMMHDAPSLSPVNLIRFRIMIQQSLSNSIVCAVATVFLIAPATSVFMAVIIFLVLLNEILHGMHPVSGFYRCNYCPRPT